MGRAGQPAIVHIFRQYQLLVLIPYCATTQTKQKSKLRLVPSSPIHVCYLKTATTTTSTTTTTSSTTTTPPLPPNRRKPTYRQDTRHGIREDGTFAAPSIDRDVVFLFLYLHTARLDRYMTLAPRNRVGKYRRKKTTRKAKNKSKRCGRVEGESRKQWGGMRKNRKNRKSRKNRKKWGKMEKRIAC